MLAKRFGLISVAPIRVLKNSQVCNDGCRVASSPKKHPPVLLIASSSSPDRKLSSLAEIETNWAA
ncbi:hypothetical protein QJS10_CPB17g01469 [Acorus calamus]|uniref:Uncharacterized protein n=1 Tax=Acorus calamus TaxID=4465 RepID=A0AAV9CX84_ACOCL|nr:hypothetical protein QJS10_CPB17g01469 [Acorus calamus]